MILYVLRDSMRFSFFIVFRVVPRILAYLSLSIEFNAIRILINDISLVVKSPYTDKEFLFLLNRLKLKQYFVATSAAVSLILELLCVVSPSFAYLIMGLPIPISRFQSITRDIYLVKYLPILLYFIGIVL